MNQSLRKLLVAGSLVGVAAVVDKPANAQTESCDWENGYCAALNGFFCVFQGTGGGVAYFQCCDEIGFLYDGYCC